MRTSLSIVVERIISAYWVIPSLVTLLLIVSLFLALAVPESMLREGPLAFIGYDASAAGARALLSAVAGAVMTVVGVLFSITIVVLQQASSQYSPRVIESFIRSAKSQFVLGFYIGTFIYCLLLVRQIREGGSGTDSVLPDLAIALAILYASVCMALLIQYIHYVVHAIQSTHIIDSIVADGITTVRNMKEDHEKHAITRDEFTALQNRLMTRTPVRAVRRGYLQSLEWSGLRRFLRDEEWTLAASIVAGDYVDLGAEVATLRTKRELTPEEREVIEGVFTFGLQRTHAQDLRFAIRQLVDVALRALSPGINDPTTAVECLNGLLSIFNPILTKHSAPEHLAVGSGRYFESPDTPFPELLALAFDQILKAAREHDLVLLRVREVLECLIHNADGDHRKDLEEFTSRLSLAS